MDIYRNGTRPSRKVGPESYTGTIWQDPLVDAPEPARVRGARVSFEPGARTFWHTHPLGQTLIVVSGVGRIQKDGERVQEIRAGDVVFIAPGEKHWHGAAPTTGMVHIAIHERIDGRHIDWLEPVSDADYGAAPA